MFSQRRRKGEGYRPMTRRDRFWVGLSFSRMGRESCVEGEGYDAGEEGREEISICAADCG